ncbi:MAG: LysR substrate-binding domain-containing protein [Acetobacterales bacterium]
MKRLEAFRAVMLAGSTSRAAPLLEVSQSAVSRLVSELEKDLGTTLFVRHQGGLQPTEDATAYFHEVERAFVSLDHLSTFFQQSRPANARSRLRLVAMVPLPYSLVPRATAAFLPTMPGTFVTVRTVLRRDIREWLRTQQFDLALVIHPIEYPAHATERICATCGVCIFPKGHPLGQLASVQPKDLAAHPFVATTSETQISFAVDRAFVARNVRRQTVAEAQSSSVVCHLVAAGIGVSIVDPFTALAFAGLGLNWRPFRPEVPFEFRALFPTERPRSEAAERFAGVLAGQAGEMLAGSVTATPGPDSARASNDA